MKSVLVEILNFTTTDGYLSDISLAYTPFEKLEGLVKGFRGFSVEDPSQGFYILIWDSFASYEAEKKREDIPPFLQSIKIPAKHNFLLRHVNFDEDPTTAFSTPITEYTILKPKEGKTQADVDAVVGSLKEAASSVSGAHSPVAWGPIKETPETYTLVAGWDSIEAHLNALKVPPLDILVPRLFATADVTLIHLALQPIHSMDSTVQALKTRTV